MQGLLSIAVVTLIGAALALWAGTIVISDNIDTFIQEMANKSRWILWGAIANVIATTGNVMLMLLERRRSK